MLTAAVRDIQRAAPGKFQISIETSCPELWWHNPNIEWHSNIASKIIACHYPLIRRSNRVPSHFVGAFHEYLSRRLGIEVPVTDFKGDVYLSEAERRSPSKVEALVHEDVAFWILNAGGKYDFTAKWWSTARMQQVVEHFRGRVLFVQIGSLDHAHPSINGVIDLRGRTTVRELMLLMHQAQGVICPVTFAMHLAAAVETRRGMPKLRPCVVIAGGREPPHWEAYPGHQFIHTVGLLRCCDAGGCWRSRVVPLGDRDDNDRSLCANVVRIDQSTGARIQEPAVPGEMFEARSGTQPFPRCMDIISVDEVIRRIEMYFDGGVVKPLSEREAKSCAERIPSLGWDSLLRATVHGASLSDTTRLEDEPLLRDNYETQDRTHVSRAELFGPSAISIAVEEARPRLTICMLVEGEDFGVTRKAVNAVLSVFPRKEMPFFVAARSIGQRTRAHLARLRAEGSINLFADSRGSANVLSLFLRLFERAETPFVCWFDQNTLITPEIAASFNAGMLNGYKTAPRPIPTASTANGGEQCWLASRDAIWSGDELPMPGAMLARERDE